jgi:glutamine synthetase
MNATPLDSIRSGDLDTVIVAFTDHYGRLMGKRIDGGFFLDHVADDGSHGCNYLLTVDIEMEPVAGYDYANWAGGYGDFHLVPDLDTLRVAAWCDRTAIVLCDVHEPEDPDGADHGLVSVAPRSILRAQVERLGERGMAANAASELEFYLFDQSYREANGGGYRELSPAGWYSEDYDLLQGGRIEPYVGAARRALSASGIPVETSKGETGLGQHELNIRYADLLEMADRHSIMKHAMKALADDQGVSVTFMAKPHTDAAGSSCHIHLSLVDGEGRNLFAGERPGEVTDEFRWFLGGWMAHLPELMVCYAPTVNSYKRFQTDSWAPTRISWANDNRTAGFRIVGAGESLRIECRVPGADVNPYLAFAAAVASGLDGVDNRTEPPERLGGDAYRTDHLPQIPPSLADATEAFATSTFAREVFGDHVVDHYAHFHRTEAAAAAAAVTDWERARYFERI